MADETSANKKGVDAPSILEVARQAAADGASSDPRAARRDTIEAMLVRQGKGPSLERAIEEAKRIGISRDETLDMVAGLSEQLARMLPLPTAKPKKRVRRTLRRVPRYRRRFFTPVERDWRMWNHDFDTILHEFVKNPAVNKLDPKKLVARAAAFADAMAEVQRARRPKGASSGRDF